MEPAKKPMVLKPGIYNVRMRTREGAESTVEVKADSEDDACAIAGWCYGGEALYSYFLQTVKDENG